jgi:hypothetical protein
LNTAELDPNVSRSALATKLGIGAKRTWFLVAIARTEITDNLKKLHGPCRVMKQGGCCILC